MMKKKLMVSLLTVSLMAASFVPAYGAEFTSESAEAVFSAGEEVISEEPEGLEEGFEVSDAKANSRLTKMKWVKKSSDPVFYAGLNIPKPTEVNGKYAVFPNGLTDGKVKLTYADGYNEVVNIGSLNRDGKMVDVFFYVPNKNQPKPGKYKAIVKVDGVDSVQVTTDIEVRSQSKLPLIKVKGSKTIPYSFHNPYIRLKTGSIRGNVIKADVKANLEEPEIALLVRKMGTRETRFVYNETQTLLEPNTEYLILLAGPEPGKTGTITYTVTPGRYNISADRFMKAELKAKTATYTGKPIKMPTELHLGIRPLKLGKDYTVSYKNNVKIGTATVIFKGKGDYTGTIKKTFQIVPRKVDLKSAKRTSDTSANLTWKKVSGATGYAVYRTSGKKWVRVANVRATGFTDKGLKKGTEYKYRVRAYSKAGGKNIYGAYSSVKTVK